METNMQNTFKPAGTAIADLVAGIKEPEDDPCEYCESHCPATGAWHCPVCDADWPEEDEP